MTILTAPVGRLADNVVTLRLPFRFIGMIKRDDGTVE
jgi:hypothetical protein